MRLEPPPPQAIVVFGASGDLTHRKLLPALYQLARQGMLPAKYAVIGYSRTETTDEEFRAEARASVEKAAGGDFDEDTWSSFADSLSYIAGSFTDPHAFQPLHDKLAEHDQEFEGRRLYYCATPPSAFAGIVDRLAECDLTGTTARIVIEKPFGRDLASAKELSAHIHGVFDEARVFRIDHYLGKETVQNLLVFRFANSMFERVWNRDAIDHIQVTVAEEVGVGNRVGYYNSSGAIRDMLQNHLLQVLAFLTMEPPRSLEPEAVRDEKVKLLRAVRPFSPDDTIRAHYDGFADEVKEPTDTETYVAARTTIDNWRWSGVPFFLRTGKRLPRRETEITVVFKDVPTYLYDSLDMAPPPANHLVINVQPREGIAFTFQAKDPGPGFKPRTVKMDFDYEESFGAEPAEAYERLLYDAMMGDHTLFTRADEVERSWEIVAPLLDGGRPKVCTYDPGTWGPTESNELIEPRHWHLR
jgi:glucose-6-phosphate 1-dehydrogenase